MLQQDLFQVQKYPVKTQEIPKIDTKQLKLIGKRFARLVVVEYLGRENIGGVKRPMFMCKCDCGNTVNVCGKYLLRGNTKSCGCYRDINKKPSFVDMAGQTFGKLTAIKKGGCNSSGDIIWVFKCDCGNEIERVGRYVRKGLCRLDCGCEINKKKEINRLLTIEKNNMPKKKKRDSEQYAKDLYCCYIIDQKMTVRAAARFEGYKQSTQLLNLFAKFIPGYKEASLKRRAESKYNTQEQLRVKKSEQFRYEVDFQNYCVDIINKKYGHNVCECNDKMTTGFELDIATPWECYELKITSRHKDIFTALGQLITNKEKSNLKPILLIPSDIYIHKEIEKVFKSNGIEIKTEKDL